MSTSVYRTAAGRLEVEKLYSKAVADLGPGSESLVLGTRYGNTHVLAVGPAGAPPVLFLPGGNFLNPTCLRWFMPLARAHRVYAPDIVGQPGRSAPHRPSPKSDGHALWVREVLDGLELGAVPFVGISYGAGLTIRAMGRIPERVSRAYLVSPSAIASGSLARMMGRVVVPMLIYRARSTRRRLVNAARPLITQPEDPLFDPAVRQLGAVYRHVRLDTRLPRMVTDQELAGVDCPVWVFACEEDLFFPARKVLVRSREVFPNLVQAERLAGRHIPSREELERINRRILETLD